MPWLVRLLAAASLLCVSTGIASGQQPAGGEPAGKPSETAKPDKAKPSGSKKPADAQAPKPKTTGAGEAAKSASPAAAPATPATVQSAPAVPPPEVLLMLVRTTLIALNQANFTGNYTVLHGLGTPGLRTKNTPEQLAAAFKALREARADLSPVLVLTPQLLEAPALTPQGILGLKGYYPTRPLQVNFAMAFQPVEGRWLIDGLSVATVPVAQAAAPAQAPANAPKPVETGSTP